ncbi:MAG: potassium channel family protein [Actinomycetes bacterium]
MTHLLVLAGGVVLLLLVFYDALAMTLHVGSGGGPVTGRAAAWVWRGLVRLHHRDRDSTVLSGAGGALILGVVLCWVVGLWTAWTLVLLGSDGGVVSARTREPVGVVDTAYFAGITLLTLGTGDVVAASPWWRLVTSVASFTGLSLITLAITYLLSVVSAVVARRSLAVRINDLGESAEEIVARGWTGDAFSSAFVQQLVALTGEVATSAEQHVAYPTLHYFHARQRDTSAPVAIAQLDDALLLLSAGVAPSARPDDSGVRPLQGAISRYLTTVSATSRLRRRPDVTAPPPPRLDLLAARGIPVVPDDGFASSVESQAERRGRLLQLVHADGWSWVPKPAPPGDVR